MGKCCRAQEGFGGVALPKVHVEGAVKNWHFLNGTVGSPKHHPQWIYELGMSIQVCLPEGKGFLPQGARDEIQASTQHWIGEIAMNIQEGCGKMNSSWTLTPRWHEGQGPPQLSPTAEAKDVSVVKEDLRIGEFPVD